MGFGAVYIILEMSGISILLEDGNKLNLSYFRVLESGMYFSAVTLLSVGYGDITPIGIGRWISIIEALIGYIMPAAFVVHSVYDIEKSEKL